MSKAQQNTFFKRHPIEKEEKKLFKVAFAFFRKRQRRGVRKELIHDREICV